MESDSTATVNEQEGTDTDLVEQESSVTTLSSEIDFFKRTNPEAVIFQKKKFMAERLLKIPVEDLQAAPKQDWYGEYLALLEIRLENPTLCFLGKKYIEELLNFYNENTNKNERELAVLGMLQFLDPLELPVPFNQHLWAKEMILDVRGIFLDFCTQITYMDEEISTYYLARQVAWKYPKRKIRVQHSDKSHERMSGF